MDLEVIEGNNGGDLVKKSRDLSVIYGFENMPYLAMFGGNVAQSTPVRRNEGEQAFDFWGNTLLFPNDSSRQFNSETERLLNRVALTSSGRVLIEQAIKKDMAFMSSFANVSVVVTIISTNKILIGIRIVKPDNLSQNVFVYIWDATNKELMEKEFVTKNNGTIVVSTGTFDETFDFTFG